MAFEGHRLVCLSWFFSLQEADFALVVKVCLIVRPGASDMMWAADPAVQT